MCTGGAGQILATGHTQSNVRGATSYYSIACINGVRTISAILYCGVSTGDTIGLTGGRTMPQGTRKVAGNVVGFLAVCAGGEENVQIS